MSDAVRPQPDRRKGSQRRAVARGGRRSSDDVALSQRFASAVVTLECGECARQTKVTVERLHSNADIRCSECDSILRANSKLLRSALTKLAARIQDRGKTDPSPDDLKSFLDIRRYGQPCAACGSRRVVATRRDTWIDCRCERCGYSWACDDEASG